MWHMTSARLNRHTNFVKPETSAKNVCFILVCQIQVYLDYTDEICSDALMDSDALFPSARLTPNQTRFCMRDQSRYLYVRSAEA